MSDRKPIDDAWEAYSVGTGTREDIEKAVRNHVVAQAVAAINHAREIGENDLRSVRYWIEDLKA